MRLYPVPDIEQPTSTYEDARTTGFIENWHHALGLSMTEDLPIISGFIPSETENARNKKLLDYHSQGVIPDNVTEFYGNDMDGLAYYARNTLGLVDVPDRETYEKTKLEEYSGYRERSGKIFAQQGVGGFIGEMAGRLHAMTIDPIYATSFLTGYGSAATIAQAALRVGVIETGIEAAAQVFKSSWKDSIGANYNAASVLTEIAFAGLGSAGLAAAGKTIGKILTPSDITVVQGLDVFTRLAEKNPELEPIVHVLKKSDPNAPLSKVLRESESIDTDAALRKPPILEEGKEGIKEAQEKAFMDRQPVVEPKEGVQHSTPSIETLPEVDRAKLSPEDKLVYSFDDNLKLIDECM